MNIWDAYQERINAHGGTKRGAALQREIRRINNRLPDNLSYHTVTVDDVEQNVAVINSDNLNEKSIISMPGEDLVNGGLVHWMDNYWLITERDANMTVYTKCKMIQCNHLLKWVSEDGVIHEQWCVVEDGTKLKRTYGVRNSLAYWKRYVKTTPLIAGNPLELYKLQRSIEMCRRECWKIVEIGQPAAKLRTGERSTTNSIARVGTSIPKRGALNCLMAAW